MSHQPTPTGPATPTDDLVVTAPPEADYDRLHQQRPLAYVDACGVPVDIERYVHVAPGGGWFVWLLNANTTGSTTWYSDSPPALRPDVFTERGDAILEAMARYDIDVRPFCGRCEGAVAEYVCSGAEPALPLCRECAPVHERSCSQLLAGQARMVLWED